MAELQRRFLELRRHPETMMVYYPGDTISSGPIYSRGYICCNAVALLGGNTAGLTHYDLKIEPEIYLNEIINRMERQEQFPSCAVVVGGDETHFERNLRILENRRISVVNGFSDCWNEVPLVTKEIFESLRIKRNKNRFTLKEVLVVPETKEVLVHRSNLDYMKLN